MADKSKIYNLDIGRTATITVTTQTSSGPVVSYLTLPPSVAEQYRRHYKYRSWSTQLGWKAFRAANGYLPTMPLRETQHAWIQPGPALSINHPSANAYGGVRYAYDMFFNDMPTDTSPVFTNAEITALKSEAQINALERARDMKVNIPVLFGEGRQTVKMIADTARQLGEAYRHFRRGRFRRAARSLNIDKPIGSAANHWLAYRYGWSPLISDVKGLAELAAQQLELGGRPPRFTARGKSKLPVRKAVRVYAKGANEHTWQDETTYEGRAGLLLEVEYQGAALAAQTGFGVYDIALTAWELTPFSFVFDWFVQVGDWLASASALQGLTVKAGYSSATCVTTGTSRLSKLWSQYVLEGILPTTPYKLRSYDRSSWTGGFVPIGEHVFDALNAKRVVDTAALWRQRCRGDRLPGQYRP
jgi:hypothetical protein